MSALLRGHSGAQPVARWTFVSTFIKFAPHLVGEAFAPVKNPRDAGGVASRRIAESASLVSPAINLWEIDLVIPIDLTAPGLAWHAADAAAPAEVVSGHPVDTPADLLCDAPHKKT